MKQLLLSIMMLATLHGQIDAYLADKTQQAERFYKDVKQGIEVKPTGLYDYVPLDDLTINIRPNEMSLTPGLYMGVKFTF